MVRKYNWNWQGNFGITCHYCNKEITRLPCPMLSVADLEEYVYFHKSCFNKFKKEEGK